MQSLRQSLILNKYSAFMRWLVRQCLSVSGVLEGTPSMNTIEQFNALNCYLCVKADDRPRPEPSP